jgi:hypothetical protein
MRCGFSLSHNMALPDACPALNPFIGSVNNLLEFGVRHDAIRKIVGNG